jgi:hypothetical protein
LESLALLIRRSVPDRDRPEFNSFCGSGPWKAKNGLHKRIKLQNLMFSMGPMFSLEGWRLLLKLESPPRRPKKKYFSRYLF